MLAEARPGERQWICGDYAIDKVVIVNDRGDITWESTVAWPTTKLDDGRVADVVGVEHLEHPLVVASLEDLKFEPLRPVLLRTAPEDVDDERREIFRNTIMYLNVPSDKISIVNNEVSIELNFIVETSTRFTVDKIRLRK